MPAMSSLAPLQSIRFCILLALAKAPMCGADIERQIMEDSRSSIYIHFTTIYKTLKSLKQKGLITQASRPYSLLFGHPTTTYQLTNQGQRILKNEILRLKSALTIANQRITE